ncbi:UNVERIFIED_CONTAM: hypothetical protein Sradi_2035000 [Sesamum radiatum]|uniref:Uncharacterized protein n=1 Tax=Sesamum radiatum TaxID=300843 RepID=A0AAW2TI38_SESRA
MASAPMLKKTNSFSSESGGSESGSEEILSAMMPLAAEDSIKQINESKDMRKTRSTILRSRSINGELFEYFGWVYHVGVNSIGQEFCHFRYLFIRGTYVEMYKRDPHEKPGIVCFLSHCFPSTLRVFMSLVSLFFFECMVVLFCPEDA